MLDVFAKRQWKRRYCFEDPLALNLLPLTQLIKPTSVDLESIPGRAVSSLVLLAVEMTYKTGGDQVWFQSASCWVISTAFSVNQCKVVFEFMFKNFYYSRRKKK